MTFDLSPFLYLWIVLAGVIVLLFGWRQAIARKEDAAIDVLHGNMAQQAALEQKLSQIDKWGKLLTIVAAVFGVILGALYIYKGITSPGIPGA
jgi:hypothetical protein